MIYANQTPAFNEINVIKSLVRRSFYDFVREMWESVIAEKPVWNWHIEYLCEELQTVAERVFKDQPKKYDLIINVPPGSTKSTICSVMFPPWTWTRRLSMRHICASHTQDLVLDLSRKSRDIVACEKYQACFPSSKLRPDQNTKGYFANFKGGMRYSATVGGKSPTGMHAHFLIVDDPIDPQKALSEAEIKSANDWMRETLPTRSVHKEITPIILIMQRLHQNDPTGNKLERWEKGEGGPVKHICLPAEIPTDKNTEGYEVIPPKLSVKYKDGLLDPIRLPRHVLRNALGDLGQYGYAGQYGQSPIPVGGGMFQVSKIKIAKPPKRFRQVWRYWDKAGTHEGGTFTVGVKIGEDMENALEIKDEKGRVIERIPHYWILDVKRGQWASHERETIIKQTARMDGKEVRIGIEQEPGSGGKESAEMTVKRLAGYRVYVDLPKGDKVARADPFSVQVNYGNVSMVEGEWNSDYINEMKFFPFSTYMDQVDSSSGCFACITKAKRIAGGIR